MGPADYEAVEDALRSAGAMGETAELHGQLCGLLCRRGPGAVEAWLGESLEDATAPAAARQSAGRVLARLAEDSLSALHAADMSLALLLPPDEAPLEARADSLASWCHGFLHGLTAGSSDDALLKTPVGQEILSDFSEISRAAFGAEETAAEAEAAYAELVEFVRVSAQLVFEESRAAGRQPDTRTGRTH